MEGKLVGMVGNEGMFGNEVAAGSGGRVICGTVGIVGKLGIEGKDGWGRVVGKGGTVPWGSAGIVGKGGNCKRWRAPNAMSMLEKEIAMKKAKMMQLWEAIWYLNCNFNFNWNWL